MDSSLTAFSRFYWHLSSKEIDCVVAQTAVGAEIATLLEGSFFSPISG